MRFFKNKPIIAIRMLTLLWMYVLNITFCRAISGTGKCQWMGSASLINSSAMAPSKCASIGGNCCNFYNASWDGGITVYYENPRKLPSHKFSVCDGCYFLNLSIESHSSASVPIPFFCSLSTYFSIFSCVVFLLLIPNLK